MEIIQYIPKRSAVCILPLVCILSLVCSQWYAVYTDWWFCIFFLYFSTNKHEYNIFNKISTVKKKWVLPNLILHSIQGKSRILLHCRCFMLWKLKIRTRLMGHSSQTQTFPVKQMFFPKTKVVVYLIHKSD